MKDAIPVDSSVEVVIAQAQVQKAILISLESDFSDIVAYPPTHYKGIIALQVRNRTESMPRILVRLTEYLSANVDPGYYNGKIFVAEAHRIRIRD